MEIWMDIDGNDYNVLSTKVYLLDFVNDYIE